eukprot:scaffold35766_cov62-Cyclotella_meneghiniana.AAC.6
MYECSHWAEFQHKRTLNVSFETCAGSSSRPMNDSMLSYQTSRSSKRDEWKEVVDLETGRIYNYNQMTRASKWKLPKWEVLVKSKKVSSVTNQNGHIIELTIQTHDKLVDFQKCNGSRLIQTARQHWKEVYVQARQQTPKHKKADSEDESMLEKAVMVGSNNFKSPQDCGPSRSDNFLVCISV